MNVIFVSVPNKVISEHVQAWAGEATFNKSFFILPRFLLQGLVCVNVLSFGARACGFGWGSLQIVAFDCFSPQLNSLNQELSACTKR